MIVLIALFYLTLKTITLQGTLAVSIQKKKKKKNTTTRNSRAIQWLGLYTFINKVQFQYLVGELRSCKLLSVDKFF